MVQILLLRWIHVKLLLESLGFLITVIRRFGSLKLVLTLSGEVFQTAGSLGKNIECNVTAIAIQLRGERGY